VGVLWRDESFGFSFLVVAAASMPKHTSGINYKQEKLLGQFQPDILRFGFAVGYS
jgi:hypothetical protein